jgi:hypothetical protein
MSFMTDLRDDAKSIISYGQQIRIRHYTGSVSNTGWDDNQTFVKSGTDVWTSGLLFPLNSQQSSNDAVLIERGFLKTSDKSCFVAGDTATTNVMKIGIGSPVSEEYSVIPKGVIAYPPNGEIVYKKLFLRYINLGSLTGE